MGFSSWSDSAFRRIASERSSSGADEIFRKEPAIAAGQCCTVLTEARGVGSTEAGAWTAAYSGGLFAGRLVLGLAVERIGQVTLLRLATLGALLSAVLFALPGLALADAALPLLSFSLAPIYLHRRC